MTITINVKADQERRLAERARQHGLPVEQYILRLVEEDLTPSDALASESETAANDAWMEELRQLAASAPQTPYISPESLRRHL